MLRDPGSVLLQYLLCLRNTKILKALSTAFLVSLVGCNVLPNNADSGPVTSVAGAQTIQAKEHEMRLSGNVSKESTVWRLGSLEGFCSVRNGEGRDGDFVVDDVLLSSDALFETAVPDISESGTKVLEQLVRRLNLYTDIKRVELIGHADERGSAAKNFKLAGDRAESVRGWLIEKMSTPVDIRVLSLGESKSQKTQYVEELATDRRVDVRIIAAGTSGSSIDSTLCSVPSGNDVLANNTALKIHTQSALADKSKRNRLEAYDGDLPLSPGDQLKITIAGDEDWDGVYEVSFLL